MPSNIESARSDDVRPEQVDDIEGGFRIHSSMVRANLNFFSMDFHDEIAPIGELDATGFIQLRKNIDRSYRRGAELDFALSLSPHFGVDGNCTWMKSRIREYAPAGDPAVYENVVQALSPEWLGSLGLDWKAGRNISFRCQGKYIGKSFLEPTNQPGLTIPAAFVISASARIEIFRNLRGELILDNLADQIYYTNGSPVVNGSGVTEPGYFVQAPRSLYLMFSYRL